MAQTQRGRNLTAAFQRNNRVLADRAGRELRATWALLDEDRVWDSTDEWLYQVTPGVQDAYHRSQVLAERYVRDFAQAEGFTLPENLPETRLDVTAMRDDLRYRGPRMIVDKIAAGIAPLAAKNSVLQRLQDTVAMWVQDGGRGVIIGASKYSGKRGRWRRVASGSKPCAFCAMLAGRGPVYTAETVRFESHPGCMCSAEIVVGEWDPTELEHLWRLAYDEAAKQADRAGQKRLAPSRAKKRQAQDTILWRMRRNTPQLFSDGVHVDI